MDMEFLDGLGIIIAWFAVVIWGAASMVAEAKRTKHWEKVCVDAVSATTVAGLLLFIEPDHVLPFGTHTIGLGAVLALVSWFVILCAQPRAQRFLAAVLKEIVGGW
jgi:hypothetical protein